MLLFGNLLIGIGTLLGSVLFLLEITIIISFIFSWLRIGSNHPVVIGINSVSHGVYDSVKRYFKRTIFWSIDFSPIISLLLIGLIHTVIANSLIDYGQLVKSNVVIDNFSQSQLLKK
jgi:uncharacterized protein YggT (Ycf19 family)